MPKLRNKIALLYRYLIIATKRLTDKQLMILLAIVVGLAAGFATFVFERALMFFRFVLTSCSTSTRPAFSTCSIRSSESSSPHCSSSTSCATTSAKE